MRIVHTVVPLLLQPDRLPPCLGLPFPISMQCISDKAASACLSSLRGTVSFSIASYNGQAWRFTSMTMAQLV
jgi:hypothetical protein